MNRDLAVFRIRGDFNNDGHVDEMLAMSEDVGNGGGTYELYLSDANGGFHHIGELLMGQGANVIPLAANSAKLLGCWHLSAEECGPYGYIITELEVESIPPEALPSPLTRATFSAHHEYLETNTTFDVCRWKDWKRLGKCEWHTWQEVMRLNQQDRETFRLPTEKVALT